LEFYLEKLIPLSKNLSNFLKSFLSTSHVVLHIKMAFIFYDSFSVLSNISIGLWTPATKHRKIVINFVQGYEFDVGIHYIGAFHRQTVTKTLLDQISAGQIRWQTMGTYTLSDSLHLRMNNKLCIHRQSV
jgi:hypothetical protein